MFERADPSVEVRQLLADVAVDALDLRVEVRHLLMEGVAEGGNLSLKVGEG